MYEDDPQDTVFDVLGERGLRRPPARPGDHRPRAGHRATRRSTGSRAFHAAPLRARARSSSRPPARSTTTTSSSWPSARSSGAAARRRAPRARRRPGRPRRAVAALPAQGHRAGPRLPRRPGPRRATTSAASRCACWTRSSAGCPPRGCSRRCARSAGSPTPSTRSPASSPTPARSASTSARGPTTSPRRCAVVGAELDAPARATRPTEDELARAQGERQGAHRAGARVLRRAHEPPRRSMLFGLPLLELDEMMARIDAVTLDDLRELAAELWAPERLSARRHRARRGRLPRRRRAGQPGAGARHDPRRRRRRRRAHGADGVRGGRGAPRTSS